MHLKKAIVVGATSGIGRGLAELLAKNQYKVGITGRREELLQQIQSKNPKLFITSTFDIKNNQDIVDHLETLTAKLGGLDLLIISSGIGYENEQLDFALEQQTIETNVTGFTCVADWAFHFFQQQNRGHLAAITSIGGLRGNKQAPAYNASKAYQINYLEGLRQKAFRSKKRIYITDIRPGLTATAMAKGEGLFWVMPVDKVVKQTYKAIRSKKSVAYVTKRWASFAFLYRNIPQSIFNKM